MDFLINFKNVSSIKPFRLKKKLGGVVVMVTAVADLVSEDESVAIGLRDVAPAHQDAAGGGGEGRHVGGTAGRHCSRKKDKGAKGKGQRSKVSSPSEVPYPCVS